MSKDNKKSQTNIMRTFNALQNLPFTTSETNDMVKDELRVMSYELKALKHYLKI